jgi:hypothetical protein
MARFLMNAMLASGGYRWTIVRVKDRTSLSRGRTQPRIVVYVPYRCFVGSFRYEELSADLDGLTASVRKEGDLERFLITESRRVIFARTVSGGSEGGSARLAMEY